METDILYVGYSDKEHYNGNPAWTVIPATQEAIDEAIKDGYTAISTTAFEYEPGKGKDEPNRKGSFFLDFDGKPDEQHPDHTPELAIKLARKILLKIAKDYGLDLNALKYWMSGGKGCHLEIPATLLGSEDGHPYLPYVYGMLRLLFLSKTGISRNFWDMADKSMYNMGKGKLLRIENIRREDGNYKVPVTAEEFFNLPYAELEKLTHSPRFDFDTKHNPTATCEGLAQMYEGAKDIVENYKTADFNKAMEQISKCAFLSHCIENSATLSEPAWWAMIANLVTLGPLGRTLIHMFSRNYPDYSEADTDKKIEQAVAEDKPKTCEYIRDKILDVCNGECGITAPCNLFTIREMAKKAGSFEYRDDGLYAADSDGKLHKVCTPIKVLTKGRAQDNFMWCKIIELVSPDKKVKKMCIPYKDFSDSRKQWLTTLLDAGLELAYPRAERKLLEYLLSAGEDTEFTLICDNIGWTDAGNYVLPYRHFGSDESIYYIGSENSLFATQGTLEEWQSNVGQYCKGNPLLVFCTALALCGPVLEPLSLESGGFHLYGPSSSGKSTAAQVAGSVCGGSKKGFVQQWRTTDNALESIAKNHNDNLLILDELSQARGDDVSKIIYMLGNEKGKSRSRSDVTLRKTKEWKLMLLSTGELTPTEKIKEDWNRNIMAGQEVRIVSLPVRNEQMSNPFVNLHGMQSPGIMSDVLRKGSRLYYGTPLCAFLEKLIVDKEGTIATIRQKMDAIYSDLQNERFCSQIDRVAKKFALVGAVGELAIEWGILPYQQGEAIDAVKLWFGIWLKERNSVHDAEIAAALENIRNHLLTEYIQYVALDRYGKAQAASSPRTPIMGYTHAAYQGIYFLLRNQSDKLFGRANRYELLELLQKQGWLKANSKGNLWETIKVDGIGSVKIFAFDINKIISATEEQDNRAGTGAPWHPQKTCDFKNNSTDDNAGTGAPGHPLKVDVVENENYDNPDRDGQFGNPFEGEDEIVFGL